MARLEIAGEEFESRRARARQAAGERGLAGLVVWSRNAATADWYGDVMYLTNHHTPFPQLPDNLPLWAGRSHSVLVLPVDGEPVLVVDSAEFRKDLVQVDDVRVGLNVPVTVANVLRELHLDAQDLGLVGRESLLLASYNLLVEAIGDRVRFTPADDIIASLRRRKSQAELRLVRNAAAAGIASMTALMEAIAPARTEGDVVGAGLKVAAEHGLFPYDIAVASGPRSEHFQWARLPSWDSERPLEPGDLIHVDFYGPVLGYYTDFVRSSVVGREPRPEQAELLEGAVEIVDDLIAAIRPGISVDSVWQRGAAWLVDHGFAEQAAASTEDDSLAAMFPGFGHCIGLGGAEGPYIMSGVQGSFEEGMVVAVEILLTKAGVGGAGFEQNVIVTSTGTEVITRECPSRWWNGA